MKKMLLIALSCAAVVSIHAWPFGGSDYECVCQYPGRKSLTSTGEMCDKDGGVNNKCEKACRGGIALCRLQK